MTSSLPHVANDATTTDTPLAPTFLAQLPKTRRFNRVRSQLAELSHQESVWTAEEALRPEHDDPLSDASLLDTFRALIHEQGVDITCDTALRRSLLYPTPSLENSAFSSDTDKTLRAAMDRQRASGKLIRDLVHAADQWTLLTQRQAKEAHLRAQTAALQAQMQRDQEWHTYRMAYLKEHGTEPGQAPKHKSTPFSTSDREVLQQEMVRASEKEWRQARQDREQAERAEKSMIASLEAFATALPEDKPKPTDITPEMIEHKLQKVVALGRAQGATDEEILEMHTTLRTLQSVEAINSVLDHMLEKLA